MGQGQREASQPSLQLSPPDPSWPPGLGPQRADSQYHGPPLPCVLQNVGCDFKIDSGAMEDRCGMCHGNGSTCHTVSETFVEAEGLGMGGTTVGERCALYLVATSPSARGPPIGLVVPTQP